MSESDMALAQRVAQQLRQRLPGVRDVQVMRPGTIYVMVVRGTVMLHGLTQDESTRDRAAQIARTVTGAQNVQNTLQITGTPGAMALAPPSAYVPGQSAQMGQSSAEPTGVGADSIPEFLWPPPQASSWEVISHELLTAPSEGQTLGEVDRRLRLLLSDQGYTDLSYFAVPDGFAVMTRIERINLDGTSKGGDERFLPPGSSPPLRLSFVRYLKSLFIAQPGDYRTMVFVVTMHPIYQGRERLKPGQADEWFSRGANILPRGIAGLAWTDAYDCTALIYEFHQVNPGVLPDPIVPGIHGCRDHLMAAGLQGLLGVRR